METKQKTKPKPAHKGELPELPRIKMPKTKAKLEISFSRCEKRYVKVDSSLYTDAVAIDAADANMIKGGQR